MNDSLLQYLRQLGLTDQEISDLSTEDNINWANEYLDTFGTSEQVLKNTAHSLINAKRNKRQQEQENRSAQENKDYWHWWKGANERWKQSIKNETNPVVGLSKTVVPAVAGAAVLTALPSILPAAGRFITTPALWPKAALNFAKGAIGYNLVESGTKKLTGDTWTDQVKNYTGLPTLLAAATNPGNMMYKLPVEKSLYTLGKFAKNPGETFFKTFPYKTYDYLIYRTPAIMPTFKTFFGTDIRNHPLKKAKFQWLRDQLRHQPRVDVEDVNYTRVIPTESPVDLTKSRYEYLFKNNPDIWKHYDPRLGALILDNKPQWLSIWDNIQIKQHIPLKYVYKTIRDDGYGVITSALNTPRTYLSLNISPGFSMNNKNFIKINPWYSKALGENVDDVIAHEITHNLDVGTHMMRGGNLNWGSYAHLSPKHQDYFLKNGYTELVARGTQLKNYFGLKGGEPITEDMLKYAAKHYVKDTGLDNNMTQFFSGIKDWKAAAEWISKYSLKNGGKFKYNVNKNEK